ncbi:hypothetical protein HD806DRAFT_497397 [Xylariaceae sp. AK1471]|nr:hypothetical protein HD806DRAFT_497397 [Xylariaceae sp. AK1471]
MAQPSNYTQDLDFGLNSQPVPWSREDDWQGIGNSRERRRIQNRINQRARRSRRRNEVKVPTDDSSGNTTAPRRDYSPLTLSLIRATSVGQADFEKIVGAINILDPQSSENQSLIRAFEAFIYKNCLASAPRPALLPILVQFNFSQALMANAGVLGLSSKELDDEAISLFHVAGPWPPSINLEVGTLPLGLQPTDLQRSTLHHPWLDLLPIPQMRDNLFRRGPEFFDEEDLCRAMRGRRAGSNAGFLVWSDPWDSSGWEVTEDFARSSWGWTIAGCWELCRSTNKWRAQRGEPPLFYSISQDITTGFNR